MFARSSFRMKLRVLLTICALGSIAAWAAAQFGFQATYAQLAEFTATYEITGESTGQGWSWSIVIPIESGATFRAGSAGPVANGANATALRDAYVASLNTLGGAGLSAASLGSTRFRVIVDVAETGAVAPFTHRVGACTITGNPNGCSFNPTIIEVTDVGGVSLELGPDLADAPLAVDDSSGPNAGLLAGAIAGAVAVGGVALGGGAWYVRRRRVGR